MSPEQYEQFQKMQRDIEEMRTYIQSLQNVGLINNETEQALRERFNLTVDAPEKAASTETQEVNESGSFTYDVAKPMNGFEKRTVAGVARYYPYYTD